MATDPVPAEDGFVVGIDRCIGFVENGGRLRWALPGDLAAAVRVDHVVVVALRGRPSLAGLDAATGATRWEAADAAIWHDIERVGQTVMVAGSGLQGSVKTIDARSGTTIEADYASDASRPGLFHDVLVVDGQFLTAGAASPRGAVVIADATGRFSLNAPVDLSSPDPLGFAGDVMVLQARGSTHFVGIDRLTGAERWRQLLPGDRAQRGILVGSLVVTQLPREVVALHGETGEVLWSIPSAPPTVAAPVAVRDEAVVVGTEDGTVAMLDIVTGRLIWSAPTGGPVARLGRLGHFVAVVSAPGFVRILDLDGNERWSRRGADTHAGFVAAFYDYGLHVAGDTAASLAVGAVAAFRAA